MPCAKDLPGWSSGQDAALSRLNQGFDSPTGYQIKTETQKGLCFYLIVSKWGVEPERARPLRESPVDSRAGSGPSRLSEAAQDSGPRRRDANSPTGYQVAACILMLCMSAFTMTDRVSSDNKKRPAGSSPTGHVSESSCSCYSAISNTFSAIPSLLSSPRSSSPMDMICAVIGFSLSSVRKGNFISSVVPGSISLCMLS